MFCVQHNNNIFYLPRFNILECLYIIRGSLSSLALSFRDIWFLFIWWQLLTYMCLIPSNTV